MYTTYTIYTIHVINTINTSQVKGNESNIKLNFRIAIFWNYDETILRILLRTI